MNSPLMALFLPLLFVLSFSSVIGECRESNRIEPLERSGAAVNSKEPPGETWGYISVRPNASVFYWLYRSSKPSRPLVLWLQGGPGQGATGVGNFLELGPLDLSLRNRTYTWTKEVNLLFVDSPVGSGYSYVSNTSAYATTDQRVAQDLLLFLKTFLDKLPEFQSVPLTIFGESYGAKSAILLAELAVQQMKQHKLSCNFKGVAIGDGWISPVDSVSLWGDYLYNLGLIGRTCKAVVDKMGNDTQTLVKRGKKRDATDKLVQMVKIVADCTNGVNVFNIFEYNQVSWTSSAKNIDVLAAVMLNSSSPPTLSALMNGQIRKKLTNIPKNVAWGGQSKQALQGLYDHFMVSVTSQVEKLLKQSIPVTIYNGQLDLLANTIGTLNWVKNLKWAGATMWMKAPRHPIGSSKENLAFVKAYKNLSVYWVLKAGANVPKDVPVTAYRILKMILKLK